MSSLNSIIITLLITLIGVITAQYLNNFLASKRERIKEYKTIYAEIYAENLLKIFMCIQIRYIPNMNIEIKEDVKIDNLFEEISSDISNKTQYLTPNAFV